MKITTEELNAKKTLSNKKKALILLGITGSFLLIIYIMGVIYFYSHFFFGTTINGMNCERMSAEEVKSSIQDNLSLYSLKLILRNDQSDIISAEELGMTYVDDQGVEDLLDAQNPFLWFLSFGKSQEMEVAVNMTYDTENVYAVVDSLSCVQLENVVAPKDAELVFNGTDFEIQPEVLGTTILRDALVTSIINAVDSGSTELVLEDEGLYANPTVFSDDPGLNAKMTAYNELAVANITYDFEDNRLYNVSSELIQTWVIPMEDGTYSLNRDAIFEYVKQMALATDTFGLSHQFKTSLGPTITLAKGGDYGWVIDRDKTTDALIEAIKAHTVGTIEPVYKYKGTARGVNDIGGTYVEVCITEQKMWCYKDGQLVVETNVVTGSHGEGYDTPSGSVWAIDAKKPDVDFTQYAVHVDFWLPFNGGVGIHDASWRWEGEYNKETYLYNGSHGCVNTPRAAAEKVFNAMEIGYPVVVYYSVEQPVGPQPTKQTSVG